MALPDQEALFDLVPEESLQEAPDSLQFDLVPEETTLEQDIDKDFSSPSPLAFDLIEEGSDETEETFLSQYPILKGTIKGLFGVGGFANMIGEAIAPDNPVSASLDNFSRGFYGLIAKSFKLAGTVVPGEVEDSKVFQFGKKLDGIMEEIFPENEEFRDSMLVNAIPRTLGEVAGIGLGAAGLAAAGTAVGLSAGAATLAATGATAIFGGGIASTDEFEQALEATGDEDKAMEVFMRTLPVNIGLEGIPWSRWLTRIRKLGGKAGKETIDEVLKKHGKPILEGTKGALEEATTEILQGIYSNWTAREVYDNTRELAGGLFEAGIVGGVVGFILNATGVSIRNMKLRAKSQVDQTTLNEAERVLEDQGIDVDQVVEEFSETLGSPPQKEEGSDIIAIRQKGADSRESFNEHLAGRVAPEDISNDSELTETTHKTVDDLRSLERSIDDEGVASAIREYNEGRPEALEELVREGGEGFSTLDALVQPVKNILRKKYSKSIFLFKGQQIIALDKGREVLSFTTSLRKAKKHSRFSTHSRVLLAKIDVDDVLWYDPSTGTFIVKADENLRDRVSSPSIGLVPKRTTPKEPPTDEESVKLLPLGNPPDNESPTVPLSAFRQFRDRAKKFGLFWFRPRGNKPLSVYEALLKREGRNAKDLKEAAQVASDLKKVIKEVYGKKGPDRETLEKMTDYMTTGKRKKGPVRRRGDLPEIEGVTDVMLSEAEATNDPDPKPYDRVEFSADRLEAEGGTFGLPQEIRTVLDQLRAVQDRISLTGLEDGLVEGPLGVAIQAGEGSYLYRSYKIHEDPKWASKVPAEIKANAHNAIRDGLLGMRARRVHAAFRKSLPILEESLGRLLNPTERNVLLQMIDTREPAITDEVVNKEIETILYEGSQGSNPFELFRGKKLGNIDISVLRKRKEIPPEIRALLGEHRDPIVAFSKSIIRSSAFFNNLRFLHEIAENGRGEFFWEFNDPNRPDDATAVLFLNDDLAINPLAGKRTTPDVKKEFEWRRSELSGIVASVYSAYMSINAAVKAGKTVGNFSGHFRNLLSASMTVLANGYNPKNWGTTGAFKLAMQDATMATELTRTRKVSTKLAGSLEKSLGLTQEAQNRVLRLTELRIFSEDVNVGELREMLRDAKWEDDWFLGSFDPFIGPDGYKKYVVKAVKPVRNLVRKMGKAWNAEDDFFRLITFHAEKVRYKEALYRKRDLTVDENNRLEEDVAKIVGMVYMDYSRTPRITRLLKAFPFMGGFVSFQSEVFRTLPNSVRLGLQERNSDNPEIRKIGISRLIGVSSVLAIPTVLAGISAAISGVTGEEDELNQRFMAEWDRNSARIYLNKELFINTSYTDPYGNLKSPIYALFHQDEDIKVGPRLLDALRGLFGPFYEEEILSSKLRQAGTNQKDTGGRVYNPQDNVGEIWKDVYEFMWDGVAPGTIISIARINKATRGEVTKSGREFNTIDEISALFGVRPVRLDKERSLKFLTIQYQKDLSDADRILRDEERAGNATREGVISALDRANEKRLELFKEMQITIAAAGASGVPIPSIEKALSEGGLSKREITRLFTSEFRPLEIKEETIPKLLQDD